MADSPSQRLAELGVSLPAVAKPLAAYVPAVQFGNAIYTSGQLPTVDGQLLAEGRLGAEVTPEQGAECARQAALNALAAVASVAGGIDGVARIVKVVVFVASDPSFNGQPRVANGASELIGAVFGGGHARSAVGVSVLPLNAPVEVELVAELASRPRIVPL